MCGIDTFLVNNKIISCLYRLIILINDYCYSFRFHPVIGNPTLVCGQDVGGTTLLQISINLTLNSCSMRTTTWSVSFYSIIHWNEYYYRYIIIYCVSFLTFSKKRQITTNHGYLSRF